MISGARGGRPARPPPGPGLSEINTSGSLLKIAHASLPYLTLVDHNRVLKGTMR